MSIVNETTRIGAEQDWKQRYRDLVREVDHERTASAQSERALIQALLKLAQCFVGVDGELDRQLSTLRGSLRSGSTTKIRAGLLSEVGDACLAQSRKRGSAAAADGSRAPLEALMSALKIPEQAALEFKQIQSRLKNGEDPARIASLLAQGLNDLTSAAIPSRADGAHVSAVVEELALSVMDELATRDVLRERTTKLRASWQQDIGVAARQAQGLALVQLLRDALALHSAEAEGAQGPSSAASLARLLERLLLPAEFEERSGQLRESLERGTSEDPVCETGSFLNDLHAYMRKDLRALEDYLRQASENLSVIDSELRYAVDHSRMTAQDSSELTRGISAQMDEIDAAVQGEQPPADLRALVERRVATIRATMSAFLKMQQHKQDTYEQRIVELTQRVQSFEQESGRLRKNLEAEHARAHSDPLTGVPNRLAYEERAQLELKRAWRHGVPLSLAVIDLDRFKAINDNFGHKVGDKLLHYVANIALKRIRATDLFARYGGEEFVALFTDTQLEAAFEVCEELRRQIANSSFLYKGSPVPVSVSIGVAELGNQEALDKLFERADKALYRAKHGGRNRVEAAR